MLKIIYTSNDEALAQRIVSDLRAAGYPVEGAGVSSTRSQRDVLIAVLSPEAAADTALRQQLVAALDGGVPVIPVSARAAQIPPEIAHLPVVDYSTGDHFAGLRQAVDAALSSDPSGEPSGARAATRKRSNRRIGLLLGLLALVWFALGLYGVGVLGIQAPQQEYSLVDTAVAATQAYFINPELDRYGLFLPGSTDESANYEATLRAVPTVYRPMVAETATAVGAGTALATNDPRTATPVPNTSGH